MTFLFFALLLYVAYRVVRSWKASLRQKEQEESSLQDAELIQDPQCGVYFLRHRGIRARFQGREIYFCSENCRDAYLKEHRHD
jgi:hypothetical protein